MVCTSGKPNIKRFEMLKVSSDVTERISDALSVEEPLEICLKRADHAALSASVLSVTMRTPGHDEELAIGFLFNEGIISSLDDVVAIDAKGCNSIVITLSTGVAMLEERHERHSFVNSSCGVCGKKSISSVLARARVCVESLVCVSAEAISAMPSTLSLRQPDFASTGGIHASALFDLDGRLLAVREDIGRHNALDKLIGAQLLQGHLPASERVLFLSGRASFELIQKAAAAGFPIVAAVGAPSSLAVELAEKCNLTLLGFVRDNRFNVYTGARRLAGLPRVLV